MEDQITVKFSDLSTDIKLRLFRQLDYKAVCALRLVSTNLRTFVDRHFGDDLAALRDYGGVAPQGTVYPQGPIWDETLELLNFSGAREIHLDCTRFTGRALQSLSRCLPTSLEVLGLFNCGGDKIRIVDFTTIVRALPKRVKSLQFISRRGFSSSDRLQLMALVPATLSQCLFSSDIENKPLRLCETPDITDIYVQRFLEGSTCTPEAVDMAGCKKLTDKCAVALSKGVIRYAREIRMGGCTGFREKGMRWLLQSLSGTLSVLDVHGCRGFTDQVANDLTSRQTSCLPLRVLDLRNCVGLSSKGHLALFQAFRGGGLQEVSIGNDKMTVKEIQSILTALPPGVKRLVITGAKMTSELLDWLQEHFPEGLEVLDLSGCSGMDSLMLAGIKDGQAAVLTANLPSTIQKIGVAPEAPITSRGLASVIRCMPRSVRSVLVEHEAMTDHVASLLHTKFHAILNLVVVKSSTLSDQGAQDLVGCLAPQSEGFMVSSPCLTDKALAQIEVWLNYKSPQAVGFDGCQKVTAKGIELLCGRLARSNSLRAVYFRGLTGLQFPTEMNPIVKILRPHLEILDLTGSSGLSPDHLSGIIRALPKKIGQLSLNGTQVSDREINLLLERDLPGLSQLFVGASGLSPKTLMDLAQWVLSGPERELMIRDEDTEKVFGISPTGETSLSGYPGLYAEAMPELMRLLPDKVWSLELSGTPVNRDGIAALVERGLPNLGRLNLSNCPGIDGECLTLLLPWIVSGKVQVNLTGCNQVEELQLSAAPLVNTKGLGRLSDTGLAMNPKALLAQGCNHLTDSSIELLRQFFPRIEQLDLSGCVGLSERGLLSICQDLPPTLSRLSLDGTHATDRLVSTLMGGGLPSLTYLSLRGCNRLSAQALVTVVERGGEELNAVGVSQLENFVLAEVAGKRELPERALLRLIDLLPQCLQALDFSGSANVTDRVVGKLSRRNFPRLRSLSLAGCTSVTPAGLVELRRFEGLRRLDLSECPVPSDCSWISRSIEHLLFVRCSFDHDRFDPTTWSRSLPPCLKSLDLRGARVTPELMRAVALRTADGVEGVDVSGSPTFTDACLQELLGGSQRRRLLRLNLSNCPLITTSGIRHLSARMPKAAVSLGIGSPALTSDSWFQLLERLPPTVEHLDFSGAVQLCRKDLLQLQKLNQPRLRSINLSGCGGLDEKSVRECVRWACSHGIEIDLGAIPMRRLNLSKVLPIGTELPRRPKLPSRLVELDLTGLSALTPEDFADLEIPPGVEKLSIGDNPRLSEEVILQLLRRLPREITALTIRNSELTTSGLHKILKIPEVKAVRRLVVEDDVAVTDEWVERLAHDCPHLVNLSLVSCVNISDRGVGSLLRSGHGALSHIDLSGSYVHGDCFSRGIELPLLKVLVLKNSPWLRPEYIADVSPMLRAAQTVDFSGGRHFTVHDLQKLRNDFPANVFRVSEIHFREDVSDEWDDLVSWLPDEIESISFEGCRWLTDNRMDLLSRRFSNVAGRDQHVAVQPFRNLKEFRLEDCSDLSLDGLVAALDRLPSTVKALRLSHEHLSSDIVRRALPRVPRLRRLSISSKQKDHPGDPLFRLIESLPPTLKELDCREIHLGNGQHQVVHAIARSLPTRLQALALPCGVTAQSLPYLLTRLVDLTSFDISSSSLEFSAEEFAPIRWPERLREIAVHAKKHGGGRKVQGRHRDAAILGLPPYLKKLSIVCEIRKGPSPEAEARLKTLIPRLQHLSLRVGPICKQAADTMFDSLTQTRKGKSDGKGTGKGMGKARLQHLEIWDLSGGWTGNWLAKVLPGSVRSLTWNTVSRSQLEDFLGAVAIKLDHLSTDCIMHFHNLRGLACDGPVQPKRLPPTCQQLTLSSRKLNLDNLRQLLIWLREQSGDSAERRNWLFQLNVSGESLRGNIRETVERFLPDSVRVLRLHNIAAGELNDRARMRVLSFHASSSIEGE